MTNSLRAPLLFWPLACFTISASSAIFIATSAVAASGEAAKSTPSQVSAAKKPVALTPARLISLVQSAHVLDPEYPVHVTMENTEVTIESMRNPKATDQDCKIDAVLLAKTIMEGYPKDISRVKLMLSESNSGALNEVTVTTGDVKAYATGTITKEELLSSLEIKKIENIAAAQDSHLEYWAAAGTGTATVAPGPYQHYRQILAGRIEKLKQNGTGTKPFEEMLAQIEADSQKPAGEVQPAAIQKEISDLYHRLSEQELAIRQAHDIASGKSISHGGSGDPGDRLARLGGKGKGWGKGIGQGQLVTQKIADQLAAMKNSGQNIDAYSASLEHIRALQASGQEAAAWAETKVLTKQLGLQHHRNR